MLFHVIILEFSGRESKLDFIKLVPKWEVWQIEEFVWKYKINHKKVRLYLAMRALVE